MDERFIDAPPAGADAWRELWNEDRRYHPRPSKHEWLLGFWRRLTRRAIEPDAERQKNFNVALLDLLGDIRNDIAGLRADLRNDIAMVQDDVRSADEALARDVVQIRELIPVSAKRNDALIAALDQKIETLAVRIRDVVNPVLNASPALQENFIYRRLEDYLRGTPDVARYVALASDHQPLFDAGCGRGELLVAAREKGISASGCDTNERSVADLKARGIDVALAGIPECFAKFGDGSLGSIAALHVVEHLPVDALFALFREAARTLRNDGLLMIETPNAESLLVGASEFWRDPTHIAPRHPAALTLLAREHGFAVDEVAAVHPLPNGTALSVSDDDPPALRRVVEAINARLFGPQDLRMILRHLRS
ncbi:MAG TPA: methyltransferase domain-containing protein [Thermoanaerobaculia bacterium]|jgi:O-antigen chain-terminating methyltransferase|nr:methyltransferase domain-containing protein [Thermoanaerobaculia bacterium]